MSQEIAVIVKDGQNVVSTNTVMEGSGATGRPLIVKAGSKQSIELKNVATQVAPDQIHVTKDGKNLKIKLGKKASAQDDSADIIIEDYYDNEASLIGIAENGQYYNFIPQGANPDSSYYSLGGDVIGEATETDWLPIALALLGAGALAALAGGGGGGGSGDTTAPDSLSVDLYDDEEPVEGPITAGTVTDDATPLISGQTEAGATVTARDDAGNILGQSVTADSNGNYTITPTVELSEGQHYISVTAADAAGNDITVSSVIFTVDKTPPGIPVLNPTDGSPITGTAEAGSTITITDGNGNPIGTTTANQNGNFSYTPTTPVPDKTVINATATDAAGNESGRGTTTVNAALIDAPIVYDDVAPVIGLVFDGESTNDARPTFSGVLAASNAGSTIEVFDGATSLGTTTVQADGSWSLTPGSNLSEGAHSVTYKKDGGSASPATGFIVDTTAPSSITMILTDDVGDIQGPIANNGTTDDTTPTISGTTEAGATVTIKDGDMVLGTTTADGSGNYTFTPTTPLSIDTHTITATAADAAGNSITSTPTTFTVTPPPVIIIPGEGQLINPVFVDGNWYYYWDRDGDGEGIINGNPDQDDWFDHDELDAIFMYDVNGNMRPNDLPDTTDTYRYAELGGYETALPTFGGDKSIYKQTSTRIDNVPQGEINPAYDDLVAIWDAFEGTNQYNAADGTPPEWANGIYWSATQYDNTKHYSMDMTNGLGATNAETNQSWVAVQVIF